MFGIFICWLVVLVSAQDDKSRVVTIESGRVRGYKDTDYDIYVFNGIPYATVPKGLSKFKAPLPAPVWSNILEATDGHILCPQYQIFVDPSFSKNKIREDCLVANIYVPNSDEINLPVLVDIHGGSFQIGYGNMLTLKHLVNTKRVIVVNFNYRLGVHGFLCLGTKDIPGNAGMKDMVALLRWVNKNIAAFGGDPNEVTISEYSAGASSVDLLLLSPTVKGLFKRAIPESGPNLAAYSIQMDPFEIAQHYAKTLKFLNVRDIFELEDFYKTISFESLTKDNFMTELDTRMQFTPCIERDLGEESFLLHSPYEISSLGYGIKVPILYGYTNMKDLHKKDQFNYWKTKINNNFSQFLPVDLKFDDPIQEQVISETVKEFYFGKELEKLDNSSIQAFVDYFTDIFFAYSTFRSVRLQVEAGNDKIYLYEYTFVDDDNEGLDQFHINIFVQGQGALLYEANNLGVPNNKTESARFKRVKETVKELWLNFICEGSPVPLGSPLPVWPPSNAEGYPLMSIGESLELRGPQKELWHRMNFWHDIYYRYYPNPIPPPTRSSRVEL